MRRLLEQARRRMQARPAAGDGVPAYNITASATHGFTWFRIAKCATRTLLSAFEHNCELDINGSNVPYHRDRHAGRLKFCVIRNPWDRLVSCYADKIIGRHLYEECWGKDFDHFVRWCAEKDLNTCDRHIRRQTALFPVADMDHAARFENFADEFQYIVNEKLGLNVELTRKNPSRHRHYSTYYSEETRDIVARMYADDIEFGGYSFGEGP